MTGRGPFLCVFEAKSGIAEIWKGKQLAHPGHRET